MKMDLLLVVGACLLSCAGYALAQTPCPPKPIKLVVPFASGGASDAIARPLAQTMGRLLDRKVYVQNKAGAAGNTALEYVGRSAADGCTLLLGNISTNAINQTTYAGVLQINPLEDLTAVSMVGVTPMVLVASNQFAPSTGGELLAYAKAHPGKINYWIPGVGSGPHLDMLRFEKEAGIKMTAVPYSGGAGPGLVELVAGEIDIGEMSLISALPLIKNGRLKAIAVSTASRLRELPNVPTAAEAGLPDVFSSAWHGIFVPSRTPGPIIRKIHTALQESFSRPEIVEAFAKNGVIMTPSTSPEEAQTYVNSETARWSAIVNELNAKPH